MHSPFPILKTNRYTLRQFADTDLQNVYRGLSHPDVIKYYGIHFNSLEATHEQMKWFTNLEKKQTGIWWAVCSHDNSVFYGAAGFNNLERPHNKAEIGFWLLPEHWKKGIMQEVVPTICNYAFKLLDLHRVYAYVDLRNVNSRRVLEKLNFTHEGTMRECEYEDGAYINLDIFAMINE